MKKKPEKYSLAVNEKLGAAPAPGDNVIQVDKANRVIRGRVVAELGVFKDRRGEFNMGSLKKIVELGNAQKNGLKSYWKHPTESNDGLGGFLGRDKNFRLDGTKVRSDFHLAPVAFKPAPDGGGMSYGEYIIELASNDPGGLSSSLVLESMKHTQLDENKFPIKDENGKTRPPLWEPTRLYSIDVVREGAAVNDFLGVEDSFAAKGAEMIGKVFDVEKLGRDNLKERLNAYLDKVLEHYFGTEPSEMAAEELKSIADGQAKIIETLGKNTEALGKVAEALSKNSATPPSKPEESAPPADAAEKIAALCTAQGHPELIAKFLSEKLSIDAVKDKLLALSAQDRSLNTGAPNGSDNVPPPNTGGGKKEKEPTVDEKLAAEWEKDGPILMKLGITRENYIADRKIELGVSPETSALLQRADGRHLAADIKLVPALD